MQSIRTQGDIGIDQLNFDFSVKAKRKGFLPVKLMALLITSALVISAAVVISFYYFPLISAGALFLGFVLFLIFAKPKNWFFFKEEYAPNFLITDRQKTSK